MSNDRDQEMAYAAQRFGAHGSRQWQIMLPDDRFVIVVASRIEITPTGLLLGYQQFVAEGRGPSPEELCFSYSPGQWVRVWNLSYMDGTRMCLIDDSEFWKADSATPPKLCASPVGTPMEQRPRTEEQQRRARERNRIGPKARFRVLQRDSYTCKACGRGRDDEVVLHVDHIVAIANGGTSDDENLQTLCADCNQGKGSA